MKERKMKERKTKETVPEENQSALNLSVDFSKVSVQLKFEGAPDVIDFRKPLGNAIRQSSGDIALDEFARKVYFSEGEVEVPTEYAPFILHVVKEKYNYPTQEAFKKLLTV